MRGARAKYIRGTALLAAGACVGLLLAGGTGAVAAAAHKVTAHDLAKNAVTSKAIKNGGVHSKDLAAGSVTSTQLAAGSVTASQLGQGSVSGGKIAADSVTGTQVDEGTLGTVPDAAAVGGTTITPISTSLTDSTDYATLTSGSGWRVSIACESGNTYVAAGRDTQGPPLSFAYTSGSTSGTDPISSAGSQSEAGLSVGTVTTVYGPGSSTTTVYLSSVYEANSGGGTADCFYRGRVESHP